MAILCDMGQNMTLVQEATEIIKKMPERDQQIVVDLLHLMYDHEYSQNYIMETNDILESTAFKRTGKSKLNLPDDFDEHFDDLNNEIASMFNV